MTVYALDYNQGWGNIFFENVFLFMAYSVIALIMMAPANNIWLERCPKSTLFFFKEYMTSIS